MMNDKPSLSSSSEHKIGSGVRVRRPVKASAASVEKVLDEIDDKKCIVAGEDIMWVLCDKVDMFAQYKNKEMVDNGSKKPVLRSIWVDVAKNDDEIKPHKHTVELCFIFKKLFAIHYDKDLSVDEMIGVAKKLYGLHGADLWLFMQKAFGIKPSTDSTVHKIYLGMLGKFCDLLLLYIRITNGLLREDELAKVRSICSRRDGWSTYFKSVEASSMYIEYGLLLFSISEKSLGVLCSGDDGNNGDFIKPSPGLRVEYDISGWAFFADLDAVAQKKAKALSKAISGFVLRRYDAGRPIASLTSLMLFPWSDLVGMINVLMSLSAKKTGKKFNKKGRISSTNIKRSLSRLVLVDDVDIEGAVLSYKGVPQDLITRSANKRVRWEKSVWLLIWYIEQLLSIMKQYAEFVCERSEI
jgi:hypothetical protein